MSRRTSAVYPAVTWLANVLRDKSHWSDLNGRPLGCGGYAKPVKTPHFNGLAPGLRAVGVPNRARNPETTVPEPYSVLLSRGTFPRSPSPVSRSLNLNGGLRVGGRWRLDSGSTNNRG